MMIEEQIRKSLRTLLKLHRRDWHWETINLGDPKELQKKRPNPDWSNLWSLFCPGLVQAWQIFHVDRILKMQLQVLILTLYMPRTVHEFMVFLNKWYFLSKLFWPTVRKNCSSDRDKLLKFENEGRGICKLVEITRTIYSNSERSEQFVVTECFFNLFLEVSQI